MQMLLDRAVDEFMRATYGDMNWQELDTLVSDGVIAAGAPGAYYSEALKEAARRLSKPEDELFEDLGAWLARQEPIRRLLRFSGVDFRDFVMRLEELPGRARMVLPDLDMPELVVRQHDCSTLSVEVEGQQLRWPALLAGVLRGMADDYGALSLIVAEGNEISVHISDESFAQDRGFELGEVYRPARAS